jgi:hypothetical protein
MSYSGAKGTMTPDNRLQRTVRCAARCWGAAFGGTAHRHNRCHKKRRHP